MRTSVGFALAVLALTVGPVQAGQPADTAARIRLLDPAPVALRGTGFAPAEAIRLTVELGERTAKRHVRANHAGSFTATFPKYRYNRCSGELAVRAVGSAGARVSWQLLSLECPTLNP